MTAAIYTSFLRYDVFDDLQETREKPTVPLKRDVVKEMLRGLVPQLDEAMRPWCAYLATISGLCEVDNGDLLPPDDFMAMAQFVEEYVDVPVQVITPSPPVLRSGYLTTEPIGRKFIEFQGISFYRSAMRHAPDLRVIDMYFEYLMSASQVLPPMKVNYDNPFEMGRALKRGRIDEAMEIVAALKTAGRQLYIPGDGVGCFSYAALRLGVPYISSENGGVGQIAYDLGLIHDRNPYTKAQYKVCDCTLVASNLMPFCPKLLKWPGPMVVYDAQCFFKDHPPELEYVPHTGYKLYATKSAKLELVPQATRVNTLPKDKMIGLWVRQLETQECQGFMTDDKHSLVMLMEARLPVVSNLFAGAGHRSFLIKAPEKGVRYLEVGARAGVYGLTHGDDHNTTKLGPLTQVYVYGRMGVKMYGTVGTIDQTEGKTFAPVMTFKSQDSFQKIYGKTRSFYHYRLEPMVMETGETRMVFRSKVTPPSNVVCLMGTRVISAIVRQTILKGAVFYNVVEPGSDVATLVNRDVWRHESELEAAVKSGRLPTTGNPRRQYIWSLSD